MCMCSHVHVRESHGGYARAEAEGNEEWLMCNGYSGLHHQGLLSSDRLPAALAGSLFGRCLVCLSPCLPICVWAGLREVLGEECGDGQMCCH